MPIITFTATFSGGAGTLSVVITGQPAFTLRPDNLSEPVNLPQGTNTTYTVSGAASNGPGGAATLTISDNAITNEPHNYGPGLIPPNIHPILVP